MFQCNWAEDRKTVETESLGKVYVCTAIFWARLLCTIRLDILHLFAISTNEIVILCTQKWGITLVEIFSSAQFRARIASHIFSVTKANVTPGLMSCEYFENLITQLSSRMLTTTSKWIFHIQPNMFKLLELTCSM